MALPAGRYGVTKNQLLKIKKLPMNTIKLIEELAEKFDLLGTAAFKNSTSVITQSSDLVESGAVLESLAEKCDNTVIAPVENGSTASQAYAVGEHFIRDGKFCTVTSPVTTSSTWVEGRNYTSGDVAETLRPKLLPSSANLNDYITEGEYFAGGGTYSNCPISDTAFRLKIMPFNAEASRCIQIIYANKTEPEMYMRTNFGGIWQSWYKFTGTAVS